MKVPLEVEKAIEREKIAAYVVGHLPIVKSYAVKIGFVDIIKKGDRQIIDTLPLNLVYNSKI